METAASRHEAAGLAHVATVSFLASRASPVAGFWIALAGGVALARAAQRDGVRLGYGASLAATLQTIALIGPVRFNVPLTQALSAPADRGARGAGPRRPAGRCSPAPRSDSRTSRVLGAFGLFVLAGGLDVYTDSYESLTGWTFLPQGQTAALVLTAVALVGLDRVREHGAGARLPARPRALAAGCARRGRAHPRAARARWPAASTRALSRSARRSRSRC